MTVITIDVGATGIQAGFGGWPDRSAPIHDDETPETTDALLAHLRATIADLRDRAGDADRPVEAVAVGLPGTIDEAGRLDESLHTAFAGLDLRARLGEDVSMPVVVANDTNAQALGCASDSERLCYVALGTGVGGALVSEGSVYSGANGFAGEIGHVRVSLADRPCVCGKTGCLYTLAAGTAIAEDLGESWWRRELHGDERDRLRDAGRAVGEAAASVAALVDPDRIVVTGYLTDRDAFAAGLVAAWNHPFSDCPVEMDEATWPLAREGLAILARRKLAE